MRWFPRWHTPESVAAELIEGLENGTLTLGEESEELTPAAFTDTPAPVMPRVPRDKVSPMVRPPRPTSE